MQLLGIRTWLMHGALLGWYWAGQSLPWDSDVDFMMDEMDIKRLGAAYNLTIWKFEYVADEENIKNADEASQIVKRKSGGLRIITGSSHEEKHGDDDSEATKSSQQSDSVRSWKPREYLLEVNPNYINSSEKDIYNAIDARWIDTTTGLFIDITTLRIDHAARANGVKGAMKVKDRHRYVEQDVFPLREAFFEDCKVKIPYRYSDLLVDEYGRGALTDRKMERHWFDKEKEVWTMNGRIPEQKSMSDIFAAD